MNRTLVLDDLLAQFAAVPGKAVDGFARAAFYNLTAVLDPNSKQPAHCVDGRIYGWAEQQADVIDLMVAYNNGSEESYVNLRLHRPSLVGNPPEKGLASLLHEKVKLCLWYGRVIGFAIPHPALAKSK